MAIKTFFSTKDQVEQVIEDLKNQGGDYPARAVIFFASARYPQDSLCKAVTDLYPGSTVFGCSTSGEIAAGKMTKGGVAIMLIGADILEDVCIQVIENLKEKDRVKDAFREFGAYYHTPVAALDIEKYVGIVLCDGLSGAEENLMEALGDLTDVTFIGGSAGDDLQFQQTFVYANGQVFTNAALLALLRPKTEFDIIKTQSFLALDKTLIASEVDEARRMVLKFNGKPALEAYSEAVAVPLAKAGEQFMRHPIGLMVGDEPYVRSPQRIDDDKMVFYCNIKPGMEYRLLQSTDIVADTKVALQNKSAEMNGKIAGIINFHCILRTLELEERGQTTAYGDLFKDIPTVGFSTYGEAYLGHINQTSTMLVFKSP
jgi:hypothetical protein